MENKKIILGLVGEIASGKDAMAKYLKENYNSETLSFSSFHRKILDVLYLPQNRENMVWVGFDMRERFGQDVFGRAMAKECEESTSNLITLPNVRVESDIVHLKEMDNFYLINIDSDEKTRYQRLINRTQNTDDQSKTWEQFQKDSLLPTEISIREVAKLAKYNIDNNGTLEDLHKQINDLMSKIGSPVIPAYLPAGRQGRESRI